MILDLRRASYLMVDKIGSTFWSALTGERCPEDVIETVVHDYGVSRAVVATDLDAFERRCRTDGLLVSATEAPQAVPAQTTDGRIYKLALGSLILTERSLVRGKLFDVYQQCQRLRRRAATLSLKAATARFRMAENFFVPSRAPQDCLARSLSLFRFLRANGVEAEHVMGVRRVPFLAHAWVEVDGLPLLGVVSPVFQQIARIGSARSDGPA